MKSKYSFFVGFFCLVFLGETRTVYAQDFHLSQYDMAPLYYNPAHTGMYFGRPDPFRLTSNYRSQWQKLQGKPYSSVSVSYDMPFDRFGAGIMVMDHIAGAANFGTMQIAASGAYSITPETSREHFLTVGLQLGIIQKRYNTGDLLFASQYGSDGLDPNMASGEVFQRDRITRFDAGMGVLYKYADPDRQFDPSVGFSVYHVNMPNESFTGSNSRLPMRWSATAACQIYFNDEFSIRPNALFMYQRKAMEINAGILAFYAVKDSPYELVAGASWRRKDAIVTHLGLKQGGSIFRLSFDLVTNDLKRYGGVRGGFELGIIYSGLTKSTARVRSSAL
jgi:type IX secretion system PorP/SprF family membrane protein